MRRMHRIVLLVGLMALAPVLAGCENFDMDSLDFLHLNDKKKLPGERKELFPEGVPGVTQGIPPEYMKGNQPQPDTAAGAGARRHRCGYAERQIRRPGASGQDRRDRAGGRAQAETEAQAEGAYGAAAAQARYGAAGGAGPGPTPRSGPSQ